MSATATNTVLGREHDAAWQAALALWGVQMRRPQVASGDAVGAFAWFGFPPQVSVDLGQLAELDATGHLVSVLAHEIGHHVLSPSTRVTSLKLRHQLARTLDVCDPERVLPLQQTAARLSNLWSDLLINVRVVRLQRQANPTVEPDLVTLWRLLQRDQVSGRTPIQTSWWVVMRAYELMWALPPGSLAPASPPSSGTGMHPQVDAMLLAETVGTFGTDPVAGSLPFGMLLAPYLVVEGVRVNERGEVAPGGCREEAGVPPRANELVEVLGDPRLHAEPRHPALSLTPRTPLGDDEPLSASAGQMHELAQTLELYDGVPLEEVLAAWYEHQARPWIRPLHERREVAWAADLPGPLEVWEPGDDPQEIDWPATLRGGPVVPGITTLRRTFLPDELEARRESVDLDIYLDSSGSMPAPDRSSPAVLAGTILAHSVLRGGGRVRITSFSGTGQVAGSATWTRDRVEVMRQLITYFGGGTTFPLDLLARRYLGGATRHRHDVTERRHLVVLSDDGLVSMFGAGQEEFAHVAADVRTRLDTGTLVLIGARAGVDDTAAAAGYDVEHVASVEDTPMACAALARRIGRHEQSEVTRA